MIVCRFMQKWSVVCKNNNPNLLEKTLLIQSHLCCICNERYKNMIKKIYNRFLAPGSSKNKGPMVISDMTEPLHLIYVYMATIVTHIYKGSQAETFYGVNF